MHWRFAKQIRSELIPPWLVDGLRVAVAMAARDSVINRLPPEHYNIHLPSNSSSGYCFLPRRSTLRLPTPLSALHRDKNPHDEGFHESPSAVRDASLLLLARDMATSSPSADTFTARRTIWVVVWACPRVSHAFLAEDSR